LFPNLFLTATCYETSPNVRELTTWPNEIFLPISGLDLYSSLMYPILLLKLSTICPVTY